MPNGSVLKTKFKLLGFFNTWRCYIQLIFRFADLSIFCVRVTLENNQTGKAKIDLNLGENATLVCLLSGNATYVKLACLKLIFSIFTVFE